MGVISPLKLAATAPLPSMEILMRELVLLTYAEQEGLIVRRQFNLAILSPLRPMILT